MVRWDHPHVDGESSLLSPLTQRYGYLVIVFCRAWLTVQNIAVPTYIPTKLSPHVALLRRESSSRPDIFEGRIPWRTLGDHSKNTRHYEHPVRSSWLYSERLITIDEVITPSKRLRLEKVLLYRRKECRGYHGYTPRGIIWRWRKDFAENRSAESWGSMPRD